MQAAESDINRIYFYNYSPRDYLASRMTREEKAIKTTYISIVDGNLSVREGHDLSHLLKDTLLDKIPLLGHVLIHIEPTP